MADTLALRFCIYRESEAGDVEHVVQLDTRCGMTPALRKVRREKHVIKPDGESLLRAINRMDGEPINLVSSWQDQGGIGFHISGF